MAILVFLLDLLDDLAGTLSSSAFSFLGILFTCVSRVLSLGCLGQIILQVCLDLHVVSLLGCLGRMILQYVSFIFFH